MKAAYLAYDQVSLLAAPILSRYFTQLDFFLLDQQRSAKTAPLNELFVNVDTLMIPNNEAMRTYAHSRMLKTLQREMHFFKKELSPQIRKKMPSSFANLKTADLLDLPYQPTVGGLDTIKDIVVNPKTRDIFVEKARFGISTYQYLFIENHQAVADHLGGFSRNLFKVAPKNSHIWLNLEFKCNFTYQFYKKLEHANDSKAGLILQMLPKKFVLIQDRWNRSVLDNWYVVFIDRTESGKNLPNQLESVCRLKVQLWVPYHQHKNSDFQRFIVARVQSLLNERLDVVSNIQFESLYVDATSGFFENSAKLKQPKFSGLLPSFNFWSEDKIRHYLLAHYDAKLKNLTLPRG